MHQKALQLRSDKSEVINAGDHFCNASGWICRLAGTCPIVQVCQWIATKHEMWPTGFTQREHVHEVDLQSPES